MARARRDRDGGPPGGGDRRSSPPWPAPRTAAGPMRAAGPAPASTAKANAAPAAHRRGTRRPARVTLPGVAGPARRAATPLVLTAADRQDCPAAATACVDLTRHLTWLQSDGKVSVRPGPGWSRASRVGAARDPARHASRSSGRRVLASSATSTTSRCRGRRSSRPGGIAFHGGSLTSWSHGCVHLTVAERALLQRAPPGRRGGRRLLAITPGSPGAVTGTARPSESAVRRPLARAGRRSAGWPGRRTRRPG